MADPHFTLKLCNQCQTAKPLTDWHRNKNTKDGVAMVCRACANETSRQWRAANKERHRANAERARQSYIKANNGGLHAASKFCPKCKVEKSADHFNKRVDTFDGLVAHCIECARELDRGRDPEKRRASNLADRERNRASINARQRVFYSKNKELFFCHNRKRKARLKSVGGSHTPADVERILRLQKYRCAECRCCIKKSRHIDHIVPLKLGGSNGPENLQALCPRCNLTKSAKDPLQHARSLGRLL